MTNLSKLNDTELHATLAGFTNVRSEAGRAAERSRAKMEQHLREWVDACDEICDIKHEMWRRKL